MSMQKLYEQWRELLSYETDGISDTADFAGSANPVARQSFSDYAKLSPQITEDEMTKLEQDYENDRHE